MAADSYVQSLTLDRESIMIEQEDEDYVIAKVKAPDGVDTTVEAVSSDRKIVEVIELEVLDPGEYEKGWTLITLETYEVLGEATITVITNAKGKNKKPIYQTINVTVVEEIPEDLPNGPEKDTREDGIYTDDGTRITIETDGTKQKKSSFKQNADGTSVETISVIDLETGDYELTEIKRDASSEVLQTSKSARTIEADGTEVVTGNVVMADGSGIDKKIVSKDGNVYSNTVTNGAGGKPMYVKQENNSVDNGRESMLYVINNETTIELKSAESEADNVVIPTTIDAANGQVYYVTVVCANALSDVSQVTRVEVQTNPQMGLTLESGSFNSCGDLRCLSFIQNSDEYVLEDKENDTRAKKSGGKIVLEKNCLKGTHKNLLIEVPDKKTMKSIKKQLNKAKAPKGTKVKVAK